MFHVSLLPFHDNHLHGNVDDRGWRAKRTKYRLTLYRGFGKLEVLTLDQRYTYRVLQTIQIKLLLLCVWAERAVLGSAKTALNFKHEI